MTREEAFKAIREIREQLGWQITAWTEDDIVTALGRTATEEELDKIMSTRYWDTIEEGMVESGWYNVHAAIANAGVEYAEGADE